MKRFGMASISALLLGTPVLAQDSGLNISGQIDLGYRYYFDDGPFAEQTQSGSYPFVGFQLNSNFGVGSGEAVFQFYGLNDDDNDRSILNIQKAYYTNSFDSWDVVLGYNIENWGVSNARTIVNVLNARDQANQVGNNELIGTPLANANFFTDIGTFSLYLTDGDVQDNFGGLASRRRGFLATDDRLTRFENDDSTDIALRFSNSYSLGEGSLDIGASYYNGTNRDALLVPGCLPEAGGPTTAACDQFNQAVLASYSAGASLVDSALAAGTASLTALTPFYQEIEQYGLTAVYAAGDTQLLFEGFVRKASGEEFTGAIIGGDHTFNDFLGGSGTMTVALEYHYDDRSLRQPLTVFDDDLFFGFNYDVNDPHDSRVEFGMFYDLENASQFYTVAASRRVGDRTRVALSAHHTKSDDTTDQLTIGDGNSFFEISLSTFF
ncbi:MAG: hypothetical protein ABJL67_20245 [Sulfitobacter sp.]